MHTARLEPMPSQTVMSHAVENFEIWTPASQKVVAIAHPAV